MPGRPSGLSAVRWGVAGNILVAWVMTIPCAALVGALMQTVTRLPAALCSSFGLLVAISTLAFLSRSGEGLSFRARPAEASAS